MRKKIVMIGNTAWGMLKFRSDLMKYFLEARNEVLVIAPKDSYSKDLEEMGCKFIDIPVDRKGTNPLSDLKYLIKLTKVLITEKPDIVLSYTIKPVLYGTLAGYFAGVVQRIAITTGLGYVFSTNNLISKITKILYWFSLKFATQVWFLNQDDKTNFTTTGLIPEKKSFILPGEGVDIHFFSPTKKEPGRLTFTLISRMLWDKGVGIFVECATELKAKYPETDFVIVGFVDEGNPEGISKEQLETWNKEGHVKYLGPMNDIRDILNKTTCLVHPTYYKEGLPRILMEANSMGIPCITTSIPGCTDVIEDGINGYLVKPNNKNELINAIIRIMESDQQHLQMLSTNGRIKIVNNFSSQYINSIYTNRLSL